jgi:hypothetical protein
MSKSSKMDVGRNMDVKDAGDAVSGGNKEHSKESLYFLRGLFESS